MEVLSVIFAAVVIVIWFLWRQSWKAQYAKRVELVRTSHLFDADWYLATYADVADARIDPAVHYITVGGFEGRDPGPEFISSRYLKTNRDVAESGYNPLVHYLEHGLAQGRIPGSIASSALCGSSPPKARAAPRQRPTFVELKPIPEQFIVLNFETAGLHCDRDEVIEIVAIKAVRDGDNHFTFQLLNIPKKSISARIRDLTGLYHKRRSVTERDPIQEFLSRLINFCEDLPIVAFDADLNREFFEAACSRYGLIPPTGEWTCALRISRAAWPGRQDYRLSTLCADAGIHLKDEYRASANCERAMHIYVAAVVYMFGMVNSQPSFVASKSPAIAALGRRWDRCQSACTRFIQT